MLSISRYDQSYVDTCRARIGAQNSAYDDLAKRADASALAAFEPLFFNHMVMALDCYFGHRARAVEGKDGNALNEVRVLCNSFIQNDGVLMADTQITLKPDESQLGYRVGDRIALAAADFARLSGAFFAEIEARYVGSSA